MGNLVFVTGGARSGKSRFAEELVGTGDDVVYIATAIAFDDEMKERIRHHRERRNPRWKTIEGYRGLGNKLPEYFASCRCVLLDCITVMVTNLMLENSNINWDAINAKEVDFIEKIIDNEINELLDALRAFKGTAVIVSNEVGMGIVPATPLSRHFRDIAGRINQKIAACADDVYFVVSGIPMKVKGGK
jgi:adenosylcobinamide kinase / adenosylcobinamide-phosphate guanylyltransferase